MLCLESLKEKGEIIFRTTSREDPQNPCKHRCFRHGYSSTYVKQRTIILLAVVIPLWLAMPPRCVLIPPWHGVGLFPTLS
jgi:hypothetical protein